MCPPTVDNTSYWYVNHNAPHAKQYQSVTDGPGIDIKVREIIMSRQVCNTQVCKIIDAIICQITYPNPSYNPDATTFSNGNWVNILCWSRVRNIFIARYKYEWYIYVIWEMLITFVLWYSWILWLHHDLQDSPMWAILVVPSSVSLRSSFKKMTANNPLPPCTGYNNIWSKVSYIFFINALFIILCWFY